jgi:prepilin-type N-terminal cleavage/methylation domain-containing protein
MKNKADAGFTLPEIIIGMMILLLIFGAVTGLLSSGLTASKYNIVESQ